MNDTRDEQLKRRDEFEKLLCKTDLLQARRFCRLEDSAKEIAERGIIRHLKACSKMDVLPDAACLREIIDDAAAGRSVYAETI